MHGTVRSLVVVHLFLTMPNIWVVLFFLAPSR